MKPERGGSLVEVLDRLLNKGAVLSADLIISVAGVPLIGLNLRAALASMETMLEYGMMEAWDKSSREWYARQEGKVPLKDDEEMIFRAFGYLWQDQGILSSWRPGVWNLTSKRLFLWIKSPGEVIFETPLQNLHVQKLEASTKERSELELFYSGGTARICLSEMEEFEEALARAMRITVAAEV